MKNYKIYQKVYNLLKDHEDDLRNLDFEEDFSSSQIVEGAIRYLSEPIEKVTFPAKSYAVGLIYAHLLSIHFGGSIVDHLSDPDLFVGNDKYFKTLQETPEIWKDIFEALKSRGGFVLRKDLPQVAATINYFNLEFGIEVP